MRSKSFGIPIIALTAEIATVATAQVTIAPADLPKRDTGYHTPVSPDIVVTAPYQRDRQDVLSGVSVLAGQNLAQAIRPTIGETLARTPGVTASSFGPNSSRPILRGLDGERVRVLTDGIGSIDVSNTSVDHAVVIDPLLAERVEVLRGPESLLYGSSAIGGVVNVIDKRIPRAVPTEAVHIDAIGTYGSAADERAGSAAVDVPVGPSFVIHADGSYTKTDDLRIGGHVLSREARRQALASAALPADEQVDADGAPLDFAGAAALDGRLPNSASRTWTAGAGAAYITDNANIGVAYSHYDSRYGVPIRYALEPGQGQEAPRLDIKQNRVDARAEVKTGGGFIDTIRARAGYAKYRHFELEEDGSIGTAFYDKGFEGRLELAQAQRGAWKGASGIQYVLRRFNVEGEEAFLPRNRTDQIGLFTLQELTYGPVKLEAGARYEHSRQEAEQSDLARFFLGKRAFDSFSVSGGASYALTSGWRIGANVSRTERAPAAEELFANGPHGGTEAYELGSPFFDKERSVGVEGILRGKGRDYSFEASAYYNWFSNFLYQSQVPQDVCEAAAPGTDVDLPCFQYNQGKARYYGFEAQGTVTLARFGTSSIVADALTDYVHATIVDDGPAPRIPPLRVLGGLSFNGTLLDLRGEVERVTHQNRTAAFETETAGYTLVNAQIAFRPWGKDRPLSFLLSANNLFDVDARRHASFLKDFAPLAGRDVRITVRANL